MSEIASQVSELGKKAGAGARRGVLWPMANSSVAAERRAVSAGYAPTTSWRRVDSVDLLRGIVMILMALDHVRDYFGDAAANPTNVATTTAPLFFTRWITHFCAPTFFFLTGTSAYLILRKRGVSGLARFLVTRGLWLLLLEVVILRCLAWQMNFDFRVTFLVILWALGWAMITLSVLVRWRPAVAGTFGLVLIAGHNLLDGIKPAAFGSGTSCTSRECCSLPISISYSSPIR